MAVDTIVLLLHWLGSFADAHFQEEAYGGHLGHGEMLAAVQDLVTNVSLALGDGLDESRALSNNVNGDARSHAQVCARFAQVLWAASAASEHGGDSQQQQQQQQHGDVSESASYSLDPREIRMLRISLLDSLAPLCPFRTLGGANGAGESNVVDEAARSLRLAMTYDDIAAAGDTGGDSAGGGGGSAGNGGRAFSATPLSQTDCVGRARACLEVAGSGPMAEFVRFRRRLRAPTVSGGSEASITSTTASMVAAIVASCEVAGANSAESLAALGHVVGEVVQRRHGASATSLALALLSGPASRLIALDRAMVLGRFLLQTHVNTHSEITAQGGRSPDTAAFEHAAQVVLRVYAYDTEHSGVVGGSGHRNGNDVASTIGTAEETKGDGGAAPRQPQSSESLARIAQELVWVRDTIGDVAVRAAAQGHGDAVTAHRLFLRCYEAASLLQSRLLLLDDGSGEEGAGGGGSKKRSRRGKRRGGSNTQISSSGGSGSSSSSSRMDNNGVVRVESLVAAVNLLARHVSTTATAAATTAEAQILVLSLPSANEAHGGDGREREGGEQKTAAATPRSLQEVGGEEKHGGSGSGGGNGGGSFGGGGGGEGDGGRREEGVEDTAGGGGSGGDDSGGDGKRSDITTDGISTSMDTTVYLDRPGDAERIVGLVDGVLWQLLDDPGLAILPERRLSLRADLVTSEFALKARLVSQQDRFGNALTGRLLKIGSAQAALDISAAAQELQLQETAEATAKVALQLASRQLTSQCGLAAQALCSLVTLSSTRAVREEWLQQAAQLFRVVGDIGDANGGGEAGGGFAGESKGGDGRGGGGGVGGS